jgi:Reverse transcriptase (RNA-dependent DNA polymerase)
LHILQSHIQIGVKEGAVLSPLEFILFLNNLPKLLQDSGLGVSIGKTYVGILMSADDISLIASSTQELKHMLRIVEIYLNKYRLRLSTPKCKLVIIRTSRACFTRPPTPPNAAIHLATYTDPIKEYSECKYLGFMIKMTFNGLAWQTNAYRKQTRF